VKRAAGSHMPNAISLLVLDVDGVLTDGRLYFGARGEALKVFHVHDGHGIAQLRRVGVQVAVISGRRSPWWPRAVANWACAMCTRECRTS